MAILKFPFPLSGTFGEFSAYRMRGVDGIVIRRKGGVSGKMIRTSPAFENTRRNNSEFKGRSAASGWIMRMMRPVNRLTDFILGGTLNAMMKPIQELDTVSEPGQRHVLLSRNRNLLRGFSLNKEYPLTFVVRGPIGCDLSRTEMTATVSVPALSPGINFFPSPLAPFYSVVAVLGVVPDLFHTSDGYLPSGDGYQRIAPAVVISPWHSSTEESPPLDLALRLAVPPPDENFSLILTAGIRYGVPGKGNQIHQQPESGCGRILTCI